MNPDSEGFDQIIYSTDMDAHLLGTLCGRQRIAGE
jgi:hypothetical protein